MTPAALPPHPAPGAPAARAPGEAARGAGSGGQTPVRALLVDNHDSYTHVLAHLVAQALGADPVVLAHDDPRIRSAVTEVDALVISPGPGHPARAEDVRLSAWALEESGLPTLGVCLGHQLMAVATGGTVGPAPAAEHGRVDRLVRCDDAGGATGDGADDDGGAGAAGRSGAGGVVSDLPDGSPIVRYHSLAVAEPLPAGWVVDARSPDGVVQAMHHTDRPWWGVQFHPESVGTGAGPAVLEAFAREVRARRGEHPAPAPWTLVARELPGLAALLPAADLQALLVGDRASTWWLDSARTGVAEARFSFLGLPGGPHAEVVAPTEDEDPFTALAAAVERRRTAPRRDLPFDLQGGYVGWLGYEARRWLDPRRDGPTAPDDVPRAATGEAVWLSADRYLVLDHVTESLWVVAHCPTGGVAADATGGVASREPSPAAEALKWVEQQAADLLRLAETGGPPHAPVAARPLLDDPEGALVVDAERYTARVEQARAWLRAGESYELCLTTRAEGDLAPHDPIGPAYRRQRSLNPAPYAALLRHDGVSVLCSSPERFLRVRHDGTVETRPIKGTAARADDPAADRAAAEALQHDPKTRAENLMIVDLLRNDLARVCRVGSIEVPQLMAVESHPTVHQLVTTVRGHLRDGVGLVDLLRATFPGGSMTGAPKLRSMDLLAMLEDGPRGIYSGTLGYLSATGAADLAIVIRTAVVSPGPDGASRLSVGGGGAIVLASDPPAEYEEMLAKVRSATR